MAPHENHRPSTTTTDDEQHERMIATNGGDYVRNKGAASADGCGNNDNDNDGRRATTMDEKDKHKSGGGRFSFEVGYYLTPSACEALRNFTYHGEDRSPIYKHILSPLAQFVVDNFTPRTMAPNTITTLGMLLMVTSYCLVWYHCPNLVDSNTTNDDSSFPTWIFLFNGLSMLIYQTLDNMDGKQARATQSSSPLGLLFDHGCDAFNVIIGATNWCAAMGMNPSTDGAICFLATASAMIPFFVVTWEEYHTGELILPPMNGPTEGLILGASLSFTSYALGAGFWHGTEAYDLIFSKIFAHMPDGTLDAARWVFGTPDDEVWGLRNCDCLMIVTYITMFREIFSKMHNVMSRNGYRTVRPLRELLPLATFVIAGAGVSTSHPRLFAKHPRLCLNLSAVLFVEMVTQLMLDRMTEQRYRPVRWILFPLIGLWLLPDSVIDALCPLDGVGVDPRVMYLWTYLVSAAVYVALKVRLVVAEMCCCLEIWCFDIVTPYDPSGKERFRHGRSGAKKVKEN